MKAEVVTPAQFPLPGLAQSSDLVSASTTQPVKISVSGIALDGARNVVQVRSATVASAPLREALFGKIAGGDAMVVRGNDGSAFVIEGARLTIARRRPRPGEHVTFAGKDGTSLAGPYTIEAFYRGPVSSSPASVMERLGNVVIEKLAVQPGHVANDRPDRLKAFVDAAEGVSMLGTFAGVFAALGAMVYAAWAAGPYPGLQDKLFNDLVTSWPGLVITGLTVTAALGGVVACLGGATVRKCRQALQAHRARVDRAADDALDAKQHGYGVRTAFATTGQL